MALAQHAAPWPSSGLGNSSGREPGAAAHGRPAGQARHGVSPSEVALGTAAAREECEDGGVELRGRGLPGCRDFARMGFCRRFVKIGREECPRSCGRCPSPPRLAEPTARATGGGPAAGGPPAPGAPAARTGGPTSTARRDLVVARETTPEITVRGAGFVLNEVRARPLGRMSKGRQDFGEI